MDPTRRFSSVAAFREALNSISQNGKSLNIKTAVAGKILDSLKKDIGNFSTEDISALSDFLSSNVSKEEKNIILGEIQLGHIQKINLLVRFKPYLAITYCNYVRSGGFNWDFCDTLANRVHEFMQDAELDVLSEGIFALLYMGTNHNRWYVQRKAIPYFCGDIEKKLLQRLSMEIRVDGKKFCDSVGYLFHSINYKLKDLNPHIQRLIKEVCEE